MVEYLIQPKGLYMLPEPEYLKSLVEKEFQDAVDKKDLARIFISVKHLQMFEQPFETTYLAEEENDYSNRYDYLPDDTNEETATVEVTVPINKIAKELSEIAVQNQTKKQSVYQQIFDHELGDDTSSTQKSDTEDSSSVQKLFESDGSILCDESLRRRFFSEKFSEPGEYNFITIWDEYNKEYNKHFTVDQLKLRKDGYVIFARTELSLTGNKLKKEGYYQLTINGKYIRTDKPFDF